MKKIYKSISTLFFLGVFSQGLNAQVTTQTLSYTGGAQSFTAPGCLQATITCYGGKGANGASTASAAVGGTGGLGAMAQGVVSLTAGQVLNIYVGGAGTGSVGGFNGGGSGSTNTISAGAGGGASDIRLGGITLNDRIIVAGGGGGGGHAGCASSTLTGGNGGAGGGGNGTAGKNSVAGGGGQGGNGTTGGAAGIGCSIAAGNAGGNGTLGQGGTGGYGPAICGAYVGGGGGGGGYYGGGAGGGGSAGTTSCTLNDQGGGGGGAGGTNYFAPSITSTVSTPGINNGNGYVIISYSVIPNPTITVNSGTICEGQSYTISPSGATSYTIQGGSNVVSPASSANYTVVGSNLGCISNVVTSSVTVDALPVITVNSGSICSGTPFTIIPNGASSYTIEGGASVVTPTANATYTVIGESTSGCLSGVVTSSVTVNPLPVILSETGDVTVCGNATGTFSLVASNTSTYSWQYFLNSGSPTVIDGTYGETGYTTAVLQIPNLESESWNNWDIECVLTSVDGCTLVSTPKNITVNTIPSVSVNSGSICTGDSFTITPTGANTYTIEGGSAVVSPTSTTSYTVVGESLEGCLSATETNTITVNALPVISAVSNATLICIGETATLTATGGSTYVWSTSENTSDIAVSPTVTTTYSVVGTDANGCINNATVTQNIDLCTGIKNIGQNGIAVYPNPVKDELYIEVSSEVSISITNALGETIQSEQMTAGKHVIIMSDLPEGIYYIISNDNNKQGTLKFIKMN